MPQHLSSDIHPVVKVKFIYTKPKFSDKDPRWQGHRWSTLTWHSDKR